ncbi:hypothetical protein DMA12_23570 [Amycolatopsis balhimycina DSM 5908]|uniref:Uncharacterized protein n=1 Tax=Amycolatopsis balhimycina DSM 5908 TaxID=1081091 RepID=A0A428WEZ3_AMYBA|nr:CU044_5270 family protein [Amycolatopsis balhimycina]RSM41603.1 hypothetical protein DMA12_23570 [Amycolatopsis balhimycina DSM 5908]
MTEKNVHPIWSDAELDAALADLHGNPGPDDGLAFARASLVAAAGTPLDESPFHQAPPAPRKSRGSWRWISVAAAVAALTAGLIVVTNHTPGTVTPAATAQAPGLDQLKGVDLPTGPAGFFHTTMSSWSATDHGPDGKPDLFLGTQTDVWVAVDTAAKWRRHSWFTNSPAGLQVPTPHKEPVPTTATDVNGPGGMFPDVQEYYQGQEFKGSWDTPTAPFLAALPADVKVLRERLVNDQGSMSTALHPGKPNSPGMSIQMVRRVLELGVVRGDVRVALWRALAQVPGIVTAPGKAGPDGRTGIGFTADGTGETLIADLQTAQLIGYTVPPKPSKPSSQPKQATTTIPSTTPGSSSTTSQTSQPQAGTTSKAAPGPTGSARNELETIYTYSVTPTDR